MIRAVSFFCQSMKYNRRKNDEIIAYSSFICGFSAIISRLDSKDFSDTQPNERQEKFFCIPFVTNSLPKPDFCLLTLLEVRVIQ